MALGKTQVEELTAVLRGLMTQMHQATDTSVNHITTTLTAVVHDLSTRVTELGQQMSQTVTASAGEATGMARAVIERADQWSTRSTEQLAQLLEKHHSQLDRVQKVQGTLDATLGQFRGTLSEYTAVTRNFSQIVTQTSTMVAATTGSTKDIQEAGKAIERVAQQAAAQVESFKEIIGSMQHYEGIFRRVQDTAGNLLRQIGLLVIVPEDLLKFALDDAKIPLGGVRFLTRFIPTLALTVCSDDFRREISAIVIEGHTDSSGTDAINLPLSQARSMAVVRESLNVLSKVTSERSCFLTFLSASGRGSSEPIITPWGIEDRDRSRRVEFKIRVRSLEQRQVQEALGLDTSLKAGGTP
jgi:flagellar motor protein MotB